MKYETMCHFPYNIMLLYHDRKDNHYYISNGPFVLLHGKLNGYNLFVLALYWPPRQLSDIDIDYLPDVRKP